MDPITIWTALAAIGTICVPIGAYIVSRMRSSDLETIHEIKSEMDQLYTSVQAKLDKADHQLSLARIDKEISDLRSDARQGQTEIRQDIKDLRQDLMMAIRETKK